MRRDVMTKLVAWKDGLDRKPLLLTGVRQCGKTYICREFGAKYFEDVAYFYFEGNNDLASIFEQNLDTERILRELGQVMRGKRIIPGKTLVIFDEIQACPRAIASLKYFCENMRELHILCAGSLLGVALQRQNISFPVGKVEHLPMFPLSFLEFFRATDKGEALYEGILNYGLEDELPQIYTVELEKALQQYYIVGGMPEVAAQWFAHGDYAQVDKLQENLLEDYSNDFAKYAPQVDIPKLGWIWDSLPKQLAKENNKFVFSHVKEGKRAADLEDALQWLESAGLVYKLSLVEHPELPLVGQANATFFKAYMCDSGLLRKKAQIAVSTILTGSELYGTYKGAFTENYVLNQLLFQGIKPYFWRSGNSAELDFIFANESRIVPVEVKAAEHTRAKSYGEFCKKYGPDLGFKVSLKNVGYNTVGKTKTYSIPLYLLWRLPEYLAQH